MKDETPKRVSALPIRKVALGVRYEPQYRIRDSIGALVDAILRTAGTPFGPDVFPVSEAGAHTHRLVNPDNDNTLTITQSDAVLDFTVSTTDLDHVTELAANYDRFVLQPLRKLCGVHRICRFGLLMRFDEKGSHLLQPPISRYSDQDLPTPRDLAIRFSYRLPTNEGYFRKHVNDFRNIIYTLLQEDEGQVSISLDCQEYFSPSLDVEDWEKRSFSVFAQQAIFYHLGMFAGWVSKLAKIGRAA